MPDLPGLDLLGIAYLLGRLSESSLEYEDGKPVLEVEVPRAALGHIPNPHPWRVAEVTLRFTIGPAE